MATTSQPFCRRVVHGLGQPTGWVGLGWVDIFKNFWWVGLGRGSKTAELGCVLALFFVTLAKLFLTY